jgi:hypothetical protein
VAWAQEFSAQAPLGEWEFTAYAERSTPDQRTQVGMMFEFRPNGVMIRDRDRDLSALRREARSDCEHRGRRAHRAAFASRWYPSLTREEAMAV